MFEGEDVFVFVVSFAFFDFGVGGTVATFYVNVAYVYILLSEVKLFWCDGLYRNVCGYIFVMSDVLLLVFDFFKLFTVDIVRLSVTSGE